MILCYKKNLCWFNTTTPIQTIAFINEVSIYGRHIGDVITRLRCGFGIGDHLQVKGKTPLRI